MKDQDFQKTLQSLREAGNFRKLSPVESHGSRIKMDGHELLNLSSNDYLGIADDASLRKAFFDQCACKPSLFGATASRLMTGNHPAYQALEAQLAKLYQKESCLIYNSGYHANIGILPALCNKNDLILADKSVHASIIDGIKLAGCHFYRYRHLDYAHLERYLHKHRHKYDRVIIVTESVFSMDGDEADLDALIKIKKQYDAVLYVDEAHAFGVYGPNGLGMAEKQDVITDIDVLVGTFGKAISSIGAFVICDEVVKQYLVNFSRALIYTTALPEINLLWTQFIISRLNAFSEYREHLHQLTRWFRNEVRKAGYDTSGTSQIIPLIIGDNNRCMELADHLKSKGFLCLPVRYPTVKKGTERIRISLSATMTATQLKPLLTILSDYEL